VTKYLPFKTWWGVLNFFVLQWFFFRAERTITISHVRGRQILKLIEVNIRYPIVPLSGWWTDYRGIFVAPNKRLKLWSIGESK